MHLKFRFWSEQTAGFLQLYIKRHGKFQFNRIPALLSLWQIFWSCVLLVLQLWPRWLLCGLSFCPCLTEVKQSEENSLVSLLCLLRHTHPLPYRHRCHILTTCASSGWLGDGAAASEALCRRRQCGNHGNVFKRFNQFNFIPQLSHLRQNTWLGLYNHRSHSSYETL